MRHLPLVTASVVLSLAAMPAAAGAALPKPKTKLIVPGKSIGGVALNMATAKAKAQWGPGAKCTKTPASGTVKAQEGCDWRTFDSIISPSAHITFLGGKVYLVVITGGRDAKTGKLKGHDFAAWKTAKGIAVGSKISAVGPAYPAAKRNLSEGGSGWDLITPKAITSFGGTTTVQSISIRLPSV